MARFEQGTLVRFNHERDGGPVHRVVSIDKDGMVELNDMGGFFGPHLFVVADDIADMPPTRKIGVDPACYDLARHFLVNRDFDTDRSMTAESPTPQELAGFALRMVVDRIQFRIDAMNERGLDGVSISKGFAAEIVRACRRGSELLENPEPAQAGLTAGGGSGSANVSAGVTGGGECAVGDAAGEIGGRLEMAPVGDPAAGDPAALTRDRADELRELRVLILGCCLVWGLLGLALAISRNFWGG